jgi:hypothetical protein
MSRNRHVAVAASAQILQNLHGSWRLPNGSWGVKSICPSINFVFLKTILRCILQKTLRSAVGSQIALAATPEHFAQDSAT